MAFCAKCGAQVNEGAAFCPACGNAIATTSGGAAAAPAPAATGMSSNVAGMLTYILGIITGIIFLVIEPYKRDPRIPVNLPLARLFCDWTCALEHFALVDAPNPLAGAPGHVCRLGVPDVQGL